MKQILDRGVYKQRREILEGLLERVATLPDGQRRNYEAKFKLQLKLLEKQYNEKCIDF